jgi:excisionase family DNA binding protein
MYYSAMTGHQQSPDQEETVSDNRSKKLIESSPTFELLTLAETAAILKVSRKAVSTWIHQGALPAVRLGPGKRLIRVRTSDLEDFISQGKIADC